MFLQTVCNVLQYEVSSIAFPLIVGNSIGNGMILHLWHVNPDLVLRGFIDVHIIDTSNMIRILDICKELKVKIGVDLVFVHMILSFSLS